MFKTIKDIINRKKKSKKTQESMQKVVYRLFKEDRSIEYIMDTFNLEKQDIILMIQDEKRIRRGE